ncbi:leucine-rich repeat-containing G-protein coupled receptor 4-like [Hylaeus volcanicus]|uniref:leucine-rich repeat-containing G-protein coupled receptor 4-like n=1 Tax=Hylaeus volcanicus TaxID=313075 RepID=UPI0023B83F65|nr:leucine-rich repeat-containing G-protein coupled receptor 4-like [Hylaeus volcanicus]XP_053971005.1 leucine-rich repeat-containing G-protein coupled receptor 4-like [Hylaeus volcanicus]
MLLFGLFLPLLAAAPLNPSLENYILDIQNGTLKNIRFKGDAIEELNLSNMGIRSLEKSALDDVPNLKYLNLANNSLESLPEFVFSNLTNLEYLNLAENKLSCLKNLFVHLEKLRVLNISCNPVMHLRRGHLFSLTKSTTILTEGNVFWSISTGTFTNSFLKNEEELKQLEKMKAEADIQQKKQEKEKAMDTAEDKALKLECQLSNKLTFKEGQILKLCMPDKIILSLEPLEEGKKIAEGAPCVEVPVTGGGKKVSLRGLGIKGFQERWYQLDYFTVVSLDLSNNDITEITKEMLNDLPEDVIYVNLMENKIKAIYSQVIENRHLKLLNLKNNLIENIEEGALQKTNLTGLFLAGNQLEHLSFVSSLPQSLTELMLLGNQIYSIPDQAFANLPRLGYLNLANNNINKLQNHAFRGLDSLRMLILTSNSLSEIERLAFSDLKQLETLNLNRNSLTELQRGTFAELENLKDLNLAWNKFEKITKDTFACLPFTLDFLHVDFNEINSLEEGSFVGVPRFTLSLAGNKISSIPRGTFNLPTLRDLHLNNNTLTTIDGDSYEGLPQLTRLWLTENQITTISKGSCKNLATLNVLDISRNPFQRLENGALYGLSSARGNFLYIYNNHLKELQGGVFDDV